jgi:hypothetical protein
MGDLTRRLSYPLFAIVLITVGCVHRGTSTTSVIGTRVTVSTAGTSGAWRSLFDGKTLSEWRGYKAQDVPAGWRVVDGVIVKEKGADDIMTRDQFANFETSAAAAYALYAPPAGVVKPADEWNSTRIIVNGAHVEHWLNGQKVVEYELWSPDWKAKVAASKFSAYTNYGMAKKGYIGIQGDHPGTLSIRNIRIRELP